MPPCAGLVVLVGHLVVQHGHMLLSPQLLLGGNILHWDCGLVADVLHGVGLGSWGHHEVVSVEVMVAIVICDLLFLDSCCHLSIDPSPGVH